MRHKNINNKTHLNGRLQYLKLEVAVAVNVLVAARVENVCRRRAAVQIRCDSAVVVWRHN